jgi:hypothetical protein
MRAWTEPQAETDHVKRFFDFSPRRELLEPDEVKLWAAEAFDILGCEGAEELRLGTVRPAQLAP